MIPRQKSLMKQELRIVETNTKDKLDNDTNLKKMTETLSYENKITNPHLHNLHTTSKSNVEYKNSFNIVVQTSKEKPQKLDCCRYCLIY